MINNATDWRTNANKRRTRSLIVTTFTQILELYPDKPAAVHMVNLLRSKGVVSGENKDGSPKYRDPYFIDDPEMLKLMETYREELDLDALETIQNT